MLTQPAAAMKSVQCFAVLLVGFVSASFGHYHHRLFCPPPFGKMNFDPDKFQGDWHVVSHYVEAPHKTGGETCLRFSYLPAREGNESRVHISLLIRKGAEDERNLKMRCVQGGPPGKGGAASLCALSLEGADKGGPMLQHQILATDYDTYAITMACGVFYRREEQKFDRIFAVDVLSRKPKMAEEKLSLLKSVASSGEASLEAFTDVSNDGC